MQNHNDDTIKTSDTVLLEKYISHFIWKGCVWEGVGERTKLQHIDPHSIGHNRVSFPFSWAAQPVTWGPTLLGAGFLYRILSPTGFVSQLNRGSWGPLLLGAGFLYRILPPTGLVSKLIEFPVPELYNSSTSPSSCGRHKLHSFNPSTVKVIILIFLDRMHLLFT